MKNNNSSPLFPLPDQDAEKILFLAKADKLKDVNRLNRVAGGKRSENSAEHSWHAAFFALLIPDWSNTPVDTSKVVRMLLVHDLVEIESGDTDPFDPKASLLRVDKEISGAAKVFFGDDQGITSLHKLWEEFEAGSSAEAKFAKAIDQFMPLFLNMVHDGSAWVHPDMKASEYFARKQSIREGSEKLWNYAHQLVDYSISKGWMVNG